MNGKIEHIIEGYKEEMISRLQELIRIESVASSDGEDCTREAPFGEGPLRALQYMMALGKEKGFSCINYDNKVCELGFGKEKEDSVGVACHVDVVPAGGDWTYPPYGGQLHDGRIYGRGAVDDKGPTIAAFYAALAIKESGLALRKNVTQIIGAYEESGRFPCIRHYLASAKKLPSCGIVPDSYFPVCFSEKHFVNITLAARAEGDSASGEKPELISIKGGDAINVVPSWAEAVFAGKDGEAAEVVKAAGLAAHASTPQQGENAIAGLINRLAKRDFEPAGICDAVKHLSRLMCRDTSGEGLGIALEDETGATTSNMGLISYEDGLLKVQANIRLPLSIGREELLSRISERIAGTGFEMEDIYFLDGFYTDPEKEPAKTLIQVYREATGDMDSKPYANGSGSYARVMNGFIPFGVALEREPLQFHVEDEAITVERLMEAAKIYAEALYRLAV